MKCQDNFIEIPLANMPCRGVLRIDSDSLRAYQLGYRSGP